MIYLHHAPLTHILTTVPKRLSLDEREVIRNYRHKILKQFCQKSQKPSPCYSKNQFGKPMCSNILDLAFNHSQCPTDYALVYSLDVSNIGVDIEHINRRLNFKSLAERFFHPDERAMWKNGDDVADWFRIWTTKEAVLKASGLGVRLALSELNTRFINDCQGVISHKKIGAYFFECVQIDGVMITIAYPRKHGVQAWQWV